MSNQWKNRAGRFIVRDEVSQAILEGPDAEPGWDGQDVHQGCHRAVDQSQNTLAHPSLQMQLYLMIIVSYGT